jgi:predicted CoA-binding protein
MFTIRQAASEFLAHKRIAVTGVSRKGGNHGGNIVYQRLRERGYEVFAINPNADTVEGDTCFHDLKSIPGGVEAVVIGTVRTSRRTPCVNVPSSASTTYGCIAPSAPEASLRRLPTTAVRTG